MRDMRGAHLLVQAMDSVNKNVVGRYQMRNGGHAWAIGQEARWPCRMCFKMGSRLLNVNHIAHLIHVWI